MTPFPYGVEGLSKTAGGLLVHIDHAWLRDTTRRALEQAEIEFDAMPKPKHTTSPEHLRWSNLRHDIRIFKETLTWLEALRAR